MPGSVHMRARDPCYEVVFSQINRHVRDAGPSWEDAGDGRGHLGLVINFDTGTAYFQKAGDTVSLPAGTA